MYEIRVAGIPVIQDDDLDRLLEAAKEAIHENADAEACGLWLRGLYVASLHRVEGKVVPHWTGD